MDHVVDSLRSDLNRGILTEAEFQFCQERLRALGKIQHHLQSFAPLVERIL